ncbi:unnamed protein product [Durusdinium trenchii]|uniref:Uncharacterized protein n=1 Tax=Durusdinium trenchii TaxID=1381693 RepID=A0ABP0HZK8_9DINO
MGTGQSCWLGDLLEKHVAAPVSLFRGDYVGREQREALRDELRIRLRLRASPSSPEELPAEPASEASSVP